MLKDEIDKTTQDKIRERLEVVYGAILRPDKTGKEVIDEALSALTKIIEEMLPTELKSGDNVLLPKIIEQNSDGIYAYTLGFVEGVNSCLAQIRERIR